MNSNIETRAHVPNEVNIMPKSSPLPNETSMNRTNAIFYPKLLELFGNVLDARSKKTNDLLGLNKLIKYEEDDDSSITALEDLYFAKQKGIQAVQRFRQEWGNESYKYESLLLDLESEIEELKSKCELEAEKLSKDKAIWRKLKTAKAFTDLEADQQDRFLEVSGLNNGTLDLGTKLAVSAGLSFTVGMLFENSGKSVAAIGGAFPFVEAVNKSESLGFLFENIGRGVTNILPILGSVYDERTAGVIATTTAVYYSVLLANCIQNLRLLQSPELGTSMNFTETAYYHFAGKRINNAFLRNSSIVASGMVFELSAEAEWFAGLGIGTALLPEYAPSAYIAGTTAGILLNAAQLVASELWLRKAKKAKT